MCIRFDCFVLGKHVVRSISCTHLGFLLCFMGHKLFFEVGIHGVYSMKIKYNI